MCTISTLISEIHLSSNFFRRSRNDSDMYWVRRRSLVHNHLRKLERTECGLSTKNGYVSKLCIKDKIPNTRTHAHRHFCLSLSRLLVYFFTLRQSLFPFASPLLQFSHIHPCTDTRSRFLGRGRLGSSRRNCDGYSCIRPLLGNHRNSILHPSRLPDMIIDQLLS